MAEMIVIAGSGTDVGKTWIGCRLVEHLVSRGVDVEVRKPVLSGYDGFSGSDAALLIAAAGCGDIEIVSPFRFRAPIAPDAAARLEGRSVMLDEVVAACAPSRQGSLVVVETAGGVMSPLCEDATVLDLVERLAAPVLLVAGGYLGSISHALTAHLALKARGATILAIVVNRGDPAPIARWLPEERVIREHALSALLDSLA